MHNLQTKDLQNIHMRSRIRSQLVIITATLCDVITVTNSKRMNPEAKFRALLSRFNPICHIDTYFLNIASLELTPGPAIKFLRTTLFSPIPATTC